VGSAVSSRWSKGRCSRPAGGWDQRVEEIRDAAALEAGARIKAKSSPRVRLVHQVKMLKVVALVK
jgi:hypothetical protein